MRVHLQTLGCRLNEAEAQGWARELTAAGHLLVDDPARADLVICNTCAVTGAATRKSRQLVRRLRRDSPAAELVVTGCYGTLHAAQAARDLGIDRLVGNADKDRLARLVAAPHAAAPAGSPRRAQQLGRERVFLKVQDGCRYRCAFCVVTAARGDEVSRPLPELVAEVRALVAAGVPEVVLTGVHVGGYGSDRGSSLTALVAALLAETAVPRLRLASVEPWELSDAFFALFADPRLLPHLHLPLQSGSDAVLRAMARRGRRDDFRALVTRARERVPGLNLTSDLIAGFPGESDADWAQTLELVDELAFGDLHVFPFSPRPGTRAAALPGALPAATRRARAEQGRRLADALRRNALAARVGGEAQVLFEGGAVPGGYTPDYLRVELAGAAPAGLRGSVRDVRLEGLAPDGRALLGRLLAPR